MIERIPQYIHNILKKFEKNNFRIFLVGGCVRNLLLKRAIADWDLATNATPQEMLQIFPDGFYENQFGTVGIPIEADNQKSIVEITTFRTEGEYKNNRHPGKIVWGKTIEEDLQRRDFTINAIALEIKNNKEIIIDVFNGQRDILEKIIRSVGKPEQRFNEDALRLLRGIRLATELSFKIEENTWKAIIENESLIKNISDERIRNELLRILESEHAYEGISLLNESELLKNILPELLEGVNVSQTRPGRHHQSDVFTHNMLSLKFCPSNDPLVKFAALLHDVGKPRVKSSDENGLVIFYNHEVVGAKIVRDICDRLHFSKKHKEKISNLIRWHMFTVDENITDAAIRRFIRRVGIENVKDMMDLRVGDRLGGGTQTAESWRLKLFKDRVEKQLQPLPFNINDLVIDGNDIMRELNIKPGKIIGELLQKLFEEVDENLTLNNKAYLEKRIKELI
ncbi:HDIG domain-containing protein [Candidatus Levyibacteriota bacterium]|nr:HD domain-containing protein [Candidatus Levybacteria bacterium]MSU25633.1 HD domain-containing protein [Candidatus Levybacteria bacterium]GDX61761.1 HDIG domain-containing protein [Candidatus Levybacteria bacterium]